MECAGEKSLSFELGPIRPPSEAGSILLRLTRNCPWNQCAFCHSYKGQKFSRRSVDEVKADIDAIACIARSLIRVSDEKGSSPVSRETMAAVLAGQPWEEWQVRQVAFWLYHGMESLFLQDADSLVMKTDEIVEVLAYIRDAFPSIKRITTYARAKTVSRKSLEDLRRLRQAGLDRLHIGLESGSDIVLKLIRKGVTAEEQILAGRKAMEAGFELSEYYMPGAGGREHLEENARESARVLTAINPTFIRLRSVVPLPDTPLFELLRQGQWVAPGEVDRVREIGLFLRSLGDVTSTITSDHIMNLLEDIDGAMPRDRDRLIAVVDSFLDMPDNHRELFIIGRRMGRFRSLADYAPSPDLEELREKILQSSSSLDQAILEILWNYI
jgi:biotin synthase-like enzyme